MWACLQDQDTTGQWKQVAGWRKVCDLALAHLGRLREYRRGLAEAWPPETNAAARAYIGELDQLIDRVQRTHDAAAANYDALAAAARAIGSTRTELKPLYDEYLAKYRQKLAYEATAADPKAVAGSRLPATNPVTDADLQQLNDRARGLMSGLSGELQQAQAMLRQPPLQKSWPARDQPKTEPTEVPQPPTIPPIVAVPLPSGGPSARVSPAKVVGEPATLPSPPGVGPILGGTGTLTPTSPNVGLTPPSISQPISGSAPTLPGLSTPPSPYIPPSPYTGSSEPARGLAAEGGKAVPNGSARPTLPGGLIGGGPGGGIGQSGGSLPPRRANPVGGVIGGGGAGTAPTGAAGSRPNARRSQATSLHGLSPLGGSPGMGGPGTAGSPMKAGRDERGHHTRQPWDPDHPWETDEGVPPVVRPPDERGPIDPGPAIGFDR
ncbi:hypothetical protein GA0070611_5374 [Micromonospora auratinigra]|uniref:PPE family protein n=1 Tax=Micromonospora auratinigra TaxID=261654 RepID=A0A1A9A6Q2_9ACTN|nr:hypothetical protein GA0070611_5374 [Micromonospora auratinigra]